MQNTVCMGIDLLLDEVKSFREKVGVGRDQTLNMNAVDSWEEIARDVRDNATGAVRILDDLLVRFGTDPVAAMP